MLVAEQLIPLTPAPARRPHIVCTLRLTLATLNYVSWPAYETVSLPSSPKMIQTNETHTRLT